MKSPKTKATNLLNRFPFTDLAVAVSRNGSAREKFLRGFVDGGTTRSYQATREAASLVYCVEQHMFPTPKLGWGAIEDTLRKITPAQNVELNVDASKLLFDLVRPKDYKAYEHEDQVLRVGLKQVVHIGLKFYIVDGDRLVFQFPQPRAQAIFDDRVVEIMLSIIHHAYATGDYAAADVELADLSAEEPREDRSPRIRRLNRADVLSLSALNEQIEKVYDVLRALASRKFGPDEPTPMGF